MKPIRANLTTVNGRLVIKQDSRPTKYRAVTTRIHGIDFASHGEAERYLTLRDLLRQGEIKNLELQVKYSLDVNGFHICDYICDFRYTDCETGEQIIEDFKGFRTKEYRLKKKLMLAVHGIRIQES